MKRITDFRILKGILLRQWYRTAIEFFVITKVAERYLALLYTFQFNNSLSLELILKTGILMKCSDEDIKHTLGYRKTSVFKNIGKGGHDLLDIIALWNAMKCLPKIVNCDDGIFRIRAKRDKIEIGAFGLSALRKTKEASFFSKYKGGEHTYYIATVEILEFIFLKLRKKLKRELGVKTDKLDTLQTGFKGWRIGNADIDKILLSYRKLAQKKAL